MGLPSYILPIMGKSQFDPIVIAWLAQLTTSFGSNPSASYITALNTMIDGMRTDGDLLLLDRFWIFAQEVQGYSTISIVNPSSTAITEVNTPTWTANQGYTGDGVTEYLNTNFNYLTHSSNFTRNSACHGVYSRTNSAANYIDAGAYSGALLDNILALKYADTNVYAGINTVTGATEVYGTITRSDSLIAAVRTASNNQTVYRAGAELAGLTNKTQASAALVSMNDYVLATNFNGAALGFSARQISMRFIGSGTINQSNFYSRFQTFATSIGFQV